MVNNFSMEKQVFTFEEGEVMMFGPDLQPPFPEFEFPKNIDTGAEFPECCDNHKRLAKDAKEWFDRFPNCCESHARLASIYKFEKAIYNGLPRKILHQAAFTEAIIQNHLEKDNWFAEITDYIEANEMSFGKPSIGYDIYIQYIRNYVSSANNIQIKPIQRSQLLDYIDGRGRVRSKPVNLVAVINTYTKWLKYFPFDLEIFSHLKEKFHNTLPILVPGTEKFNKYSGMTSACIHSEEDFIQILIRSTKSMLAAIDTSSLLARGIISDAKKYQIEVIGADHKIRQLRLLVDFNRGEMRYITVLKKWLEGEREYIKELLPLLKETPETKKDSKRRQLQEILQRHGFFELPLVVELSTESQDRLLEIIFSEQIPYKIAMFDFLAFLPHLKKNYFDANCRLHKEISKWFGGDKDGRQVKGNIAVLNPKSKEDRGRFTAFLKKEQVISDYKQLK